MRPRVKNSKGRRGYSRTFDGRTVSIIGAGRLGTALGIALSKAGYEIRLAVTTKSSTARRAAKAIGKNVVGISENQITSAGSTYVELLQRSALIVIATPDDIINEVARKTAKLIEANLTDRRSKKTRTALHTSGALSSAELQPLEKLGFATGSLHPLVSISDAGSGSAMFHGAFFCVEGDRTAIRTATSVAKALGGRTFKVDAEWKALYHAAAVMAAGNVVALFDIALTMFQRCGLTNARSRAALLSLMRTSIANLERMKPPEALTGPFARGDLETVRKHLAAMKSQNLDLAREAFSILGRWSVNLAAHRRKVPADLKELAKLLWDE